MNVHMPSVIKAGVIAAVVSGILAVLTAIPFVGGFIWLCTCFAGFLIPVGAGLLYGNFAPGQEDLAQSAIGGGLAGAIGGLIYGVISGLSTTVLATLIQSGDVETAVTALTAGIVGTLISCCGTAIGGLIFGAIGGALWTVFQGRKGSAAAA
ncbi:MAG: hypothetical protein L0332_23800 [Chloroflexi bacterium]|nr:hypothetical protein [Chloroflexota bacterium]MCI0580413.1 hypothetical protein [Chloroflexota bacterium]MCI0647287.1 hypothetical protein [Chloroflexota bacterium]MCI0729718.1 hypothetical protein [Chloroflexota bacterium]